MSTVASLIQQHPTLFQEVIWPWGPIRAKFVLLDAGRAPPPHLIANVNVVPRVGNRDQWVMIQLADGAWEMPGGTRELDEDYVTTARRELLEEAGTRLHTLRVFGAWHCYSLAEKPYRPHLPFPEFYRVVCLGDVELVKSPSNPSDGEHVAAVEGVPLETAIVRFVSSGRHDLAELYHLAACL